MKIFHKVNQFNISQAGMSLLDVCVLIILVSLLLLPLINIMKIDRLIKETQQHNGNVEDLSIAISNYALENGALPLPADPTLPTTDVNVFKSIPLSNIPVDCTNSGPGKKFNGSIDTNGVLCRAKSSVDLNPSRQVYIGTLPVTDLGLPIDNGLDGHGNKFLYVVTKSLTNPATFNDNNGAISISNFSGAPVINNAHFVILSYGKNARGGFNKDGILTATSCPSTNNESLNYFACKSGGGQKAGHFSAPFSGASLEHTVNLGSSSSYFDDSLAYKKSVLGRLWTPADIEYQFFTAGRNVGLGYSNNIPGRPPEAISIKAGNFKSLTIKSAALCDPTKSKCFKADDIATPKSSSPPVYCGSANALKEISHNSFSAKATCEAYSKINGFISSCPHGAKEFLSDGSFSCATY